MFETYEGYLKNLCKKFAGFVKTSPCFLSFGHTNTDFTVSNMDKDEIEVFHVDFSEDAGDFIAEIKGVLRKKWYPKFIKEETVWREPSKEQIKKLMDQGWSFDDAFRQGSYYSYNRVFTLDKVNHKKNTVVLWEEENDTWKSYILTKPTSLFLKEIKHKSPQERMEYFEEISKLFHEQEKQ